MAPTVADYLLERLRAWDVQHVFATRVTGSTASWRPGAGRTTSRSSSRRGTRDGRLRGRRYAKFTGNIGVCMATSGPGAIHLLNGLYDASSTTSRSSRSSGRPAVAPWAFVPAGSRPAVAVQGRRSDYLQMVTVPSSCPTCWTGRSGRARRAARPPPSSSPQTSRNCPTPRRPTRSRWSRRPRRQLATTAPRRRIAKAAEILNAGRKWPSRRPGRARRAGRARAGRRATGGRSRQAPCSARTCCRTSCRT